MTGIPTGVITDWVTDPATAAGDYATGLDPAELDAINRTVSNVMWVLSGWNWPGVETRTVRPDPGRCGCYDPATAGWTTYTPTAGWAADAGWAATRPAPWPRDRIRLPGPIDSVTAVTINGSALAGSAYQVQAPATLLRVDGAAWPQSQRLDRDPTVVPSAGQTGYAWQITYRQGAEPPADGVHAAEVLLRELARAATSEDCRLPWAGAVVTSARRGESITWNDVGKMLAAGDVGLPEVTLWLALARGNRPPLARRPRVQSAATRPRPSRAIWR